MHKLNFGISAQIHHRARWLILLVLLATGIPSTVDQPVGTQEADEKIDFGREIRPLLSNHCFTCHGPDQQTREADLRLDLRAGLFGPAESGSTPVTPGDLENSELWQRISSTNDGLVMPPPEAEHQLDNRQREKLKQWILAGAPWSVHWAFEPPISPPLPDTGLDSWSRSPIDRLVLAGMRPHGLEPAPEASREMLLRRVSLDLTGLPPTLQERRAYLDDQAPGAYERLVDRLLDSPQYGQQMALAWLDAARYADSNGYQNDFGRSMWPWRDGVIDAYNANQPMDQFIIEQLAGDLLPNPSLSQRVASGFNRNNRTVTEGGSINEEWLVENVVDRVETTSAALMGLTAGCARCHDHKYDPLSQEEFYQLFAFFNNTSEKGVYNELRGNSPPYIAVPSAEQQAQLRQIDQEIAQLNLKIEALQNRLKPQRQSWNEALASSTPTDATKGRPMTMDIVGNDNPPTQIAVAKSVPDERRIDTILGPAIQFRGRDSDTVQVDSQLQLHHDQPFSVVTWIKPMGEGAIISRMDQQDAYRGFDLLLTKQLKLNVHLIHQWTGDAIKITTRQALRKGQWNQLSVTYDGSQRAAGLKVFFDAFPIGLDINNDTLSGPTTTEHPMWLGKRGQTKPWNGLLAGLTVFDSSLSFSEVVARYRQAESVLAGIGIDKRNEEQRQLAQRLFDNGFSAELNELRSRQVQLSQKRLQIEKAAPTAMVMDVRTERRPTYILQRGQYDLPQKDKLIRAAVPAFLPPFKAEHSKHLPEGAEPDRLSLARWLVDPAHPLTARVIVNSVWQHHFGVGLHRTPEDFGVQSLPPQQQTLLDWLAVDLIENGWNLKRLHRQIVTSQTYRQSSIVSAKKRQQDPDNIWLARGPRFRLSAETLRDNALAIAGLINLKMGGPPVKPYQPAGLWKELAGGASQGPYRQDKGEAIYRRSIYINRKRTVPPPGMSTFDAGSREVCQVARQRTNTPLQALALLNDVTFVEAARSLAMEVYRASDDDSNRLKLAFTRATCREPSAAELGRLQQALQRYRIRFSADPTQAQQLIEVGQLPVDTTISPVDLAAWTSIASLILNLDETITRE